MFVRPGTDGDRDGIARLARASFDRVYAFFAVRGVRTARPLLVAEEAGTLVGFLVGRIFDGEPAIGYVYFVGVEPHWRGRGIAKALVSEALRDFGVHRASRAFAAVSRDNVGSRRLFESLGFHDTPRRSLRRWYGWRGVVVRMRMVIAPHEVLMVRPLS